MNLNFNSIVPLTISCLILLNHSKASPDYLNPDEARDRISLTDLYHEGAIREILASDERQNTAINQIFSSIAEIKRELGDLALVQDSIVENLNKLTDSVTGQTSSLLAKIELVENNGNESFKLIENQIYNMNSTLIGGMKIQLRNLTAIQDSVVQNLTKTIDTVEIFHPQAFRNNLACCELRKIGVNKTGNYRIRVKDTFVQVRCDMDTEGGGWTVIQRRTLDGIGVNFNRGWVDYERGFGTVPDSYWIGLANIAELTKNRDQEIRFDMELFNNRKPYAKYKNFYVSGIENWYKVSIGNYSGTAGNSMTYHDGAQFTTLDNDNDGKWFGSCAEERKGGWWYKDCGLAHPNGILFSTEKLNDSSIYWYTFHSTNSLKFMEMKIRNKNPALCGL